MKAAASSLGGSAGAAAADGARRAPAAAALPYLAAKTDGPRRAAAAAEMRLYVGGLPPDITPLDVEGRFKPFGAVASCELVPSKGPGADPGACRGFAYVEFQPKDDASLARCLSLVSAAGGEPGAACR